MGKILALDFGEKRIGYAVSDDDHTIAFPRGSFAAVSGQKALTRIGEIVREEGVSRIIIGVPLDEENGETAISAKARKFGEKIARRYMLPISYVDEFNSSREALSKIPFRRDRREKGAADAIAAQIILQRYLDGK